MDWQCVWGEHYLRNHDEHRCVRQRRITTSQAYDSTTGTLTGVSNNSIGVANLATLPYEGQGLIDGMSYLNTSGSPVATRYDELRWGSASHWHDDVAEQRDDALQ